MSRLTELRYRCAQYPTESNFKLVREELKRIRAQQGDRFNQRPKD